MTKETKFRIRSITDKVALKFGSEVWMIKIGDEQRLEAKTNEIFKTTVRNY
jgi:hypothetical protein